MIRLLVPHTTDVYRLGWSAPAIRYVLTAALASGYLRRQAVYETVLIMVADDRYNKWINVRNSDAVADLGLRLMTTHEIEYWSRSAVR